MMMKMERFQAVCVAMGMTVAMTVPASAVSAESIAGPTGGTASASIELQIRELRNLTRERFAQISSELSSQVASETMSLIEVFVESNTLECLELVLEGICLWLVIRVTPAGLVATIEMTPELSHYNPDFVVTSFSSIGGSPLVESDLLYDTVQTEISAAMLKLMSGRSVPAAYRDEDQYGGRAAESNRGKSTISQYSEVEVLGHPGNVITLIASGGDLFSGATDVAEQQIAGVRQIAMSAQKQANLILGELRGREKALPSTVGNVSEWADKVPGGGDLNQWEDQLLLPTDLGILEILGLAFDGFDGINGAIDTITNGSSSVSAQHSASEYLQNIGTEVGKTVSEADDFDELQAVFAGKTNGLDVTEEAQNRFDATDVDYAALGPKAQQDILDEINSASPDELKELYGDVPREELTAQVTSLTDHFGKLDGAEKTLQDSGASFGGGLLFCPSDTTILTPHYLSGLNTLAWRYQLPELAYPQSYAFPIPGSEYYVGKFKPGNITKPLDSSGKVARWAEKLPIPDWSTWGNIYPRSGWIAQPDEVKNRALAAFRATHVVTRPDQAHLYNYAEHKHPKKIRFESHPKKLHPHEKKTGAWQMLYPKKASSCELLQDTPIDAGVVTQRDPAMTSESGAYIYNVWRNYQCCHEPEGPGSKTYLFTIPLGIKII